MGIEALHLPLLERGAGRMAAAGALACCALLLGACEPGAERAPPSVDQTVLCEVGDYELASECKPGQKIVFLPRSFGNEQLPIMFAALNCDLRYAVALTRGAVTCIFGPITPRQSAGAPSSAASQP